MKDEYRPSHSFGNAVAIANRAGRTFSLVDQYSLEAIKEVALPDNGEPMHYAFSQSKSEIWDGDRANNRHAIYKMLGCELVYDGTIEAPRGLFHSMIAQTTGSSYPIMAVTCDIDNRIPVYDLTSRRLLVTLEPPSEAAAAGARSHDVTLTDDYIFVTFLGGTDSSNGYVACYEATAPYDIIGVLETVPDPHVAIRDDTSLFVAAQGGGDGGVVYMVSVPDMTPISETPRPTPHGMFISFDSKYLYTTNIGLGGSNAIDVWDVATGQLLDCPEVTTSNPVPDNPTLSMDNSRIFITHFGGASEVNSAFDIDMKTGCVIPESKEIVKTNFNPFWLFVIPPAGPLTTCANSIN